MSIRHEYSPYDATGSQEHWFDPKVIAFALAESGVKEGEEPTSAEPWRPAERKTFAGLEGPDEAQKACGKFWLEDKRHDRWVMSSMTDRLIEKAKAVQVAREAREEDFRKSSKKETKHETVRRQKCMCSIANTYFAGEDSKTRCCPCSKYDPVVTVPNSLFNKTEAAIDLEAAGKRLIVEALQENDGLWDDVDPIIMKNFVVQMDKYTPPIFAATPGQVVTYKIRPLARAAYVEQAMHRSEVGALVTLDRVEFELNMYLLPQLLKWCEEFCATKRGLLREAKRTVEIQQEQLPDYLKVHGPVRQERATQTLLHELKWRGLASHDAGIKVDASGMVTKSQVGEAKPIHGIHVGHAARPRLVCRCGHAEVWHSAPLPKEPTMGKSSSTGALPLEPSRPKDSVPRRTVPPPKMPPVRAKPELTLHAGRLKFAEAGASLVGVPSAGNLFWPQDIREATACGV